MLIKWMQMTYEIPAKSDRDYQVIGLSWAENKQFWLKEKSENALWYRSMNYVLLVTNCIFSLQYTFVNFDVDFWFFLTVQTLHALHLRSLVQSKW